MGRVRGVLFFSFLRLLAGNQLTEGNAVNTNGYRAGGDEIAALLAVMMPGEDYTAEDLAARLGWTISTTRALIHAAEDTGVLWQHRVSKGPLMWVRRERRSRPAIRSWNEVGELRDYECQWRTFRDLCMLAHSAQNSASDRRQISSP
jgi:hypothetical protein